MIQTFFIPGRLPGLNEIILASTQRRGKGNAYSAMKKAWGREIGLIARMTGFQPIERGHFMFHHYEKDRRRDPDNFIAGAQKLILDALVSEELLPGDGWKQVLSIDHDWEVRAADDGVQLTVAAV